MWSSKKTTEVSNAEKVGKKKKLKQKSGKKK